MKQVVVRVEREADQAAVFAINTAAFETDAEAKLVDALRAVVKPYVSLVAEIEEVVVGHILFTPVTLEGHPNRFLMGLAPMAVAPENQRQGIGAALIRAGLDACREHDVGGVVVLGHPEYYPRFGFMPSSRLGIRSTYDVPEEVFMAQELVPGYLDGASGVVHYHGTFNGL